MATETSGTTATETTLSPWHYITEMTGTICSEMGGPMATELSTLAHFHRNNHFVRQQYIDYGVGRWAIIDKKTNEFMGWTGLEYVTKETNNHKNYYDLGYRLIGYATESAFASLDYALNKLNATAVFGMADCENEASNNILRKVGLKFIQIFDHEGVNYNWYKIDKAEYYSASRSNN